MIEEKIVLLRLLVGFLGEKNQFNWWDTSFLNDTGIKFLELNFPRSARIAAINSVGEAAKKLHDERIGKGGVIHLFRLSYHLEQSIIKRLNSYDINELFELINSKENALDELKNISSDLKSSAEGPIQIESNNFIINEINLSEMAGLYLDAFNNNNHVFPYLVIKEK